jgi:phosphoribosylanthranilate isomerase
MRGNLTPGHRLLTISIFTPLRQALLPRGEFGYLCIPMRTRVKICGITSNQDAMEAVRHGADAIGLVFYPPSPRAVTAEQAVHILAGLPPFVTVVGLFVDARREAILGLLQRVRIDLLQFHGNETPEQCRGLGRPYIKAIPMKEGVDLFVERTRFHDAAALLVDTHKPGLPGGTGETFEWEHLPHGLAHSLILAGGLTPDNVSRAIETVRPYAVDVSGGVEKSRGIKDPEKIAAFMRGVERANP